VFDKNFTTYVPDRDDWIHNAVTLNDDLVCLTDGSRIERTGLAGAGVYVQTDGEELVLPLGIVTPPSFRQKFMPMLNASSESNTW